MSCNSGFCLKCEGFIEYPTRGELYLWYPTQHLLGKLRTALTDFSVTFHTAYDCVHVRDVQSKQLGDLFRGHLNPIEMKDFKAAFLPLGEEPGLANIRMMDSLHGLLQKIKNGWLPELISANKLTSYFQPLVYADEPSKVFAYEALLRGLTDEGVMPAGKILEAAKESDMLFQVDREARLSAIRKASEHNIETKVFVNFMPTAIYDPETCLRTTERAIDESKIKASQVVFEVVESEQVADSDHLLRVLGFYRERGFQVALDDLGAGFGSLNLMNILRPDFVKLDMNLIRDVDSDPFKAIVTKRLLQMAQELEIKTVVEGVETVEEFEWLRGHGATFAQGYLFARPSQAPPKVSNPLLERSI